MLFEKIHLEPDEHIITIVRKHWFFLASNMLVILIGMIVPLLAWISIFFIDNTSVLYPLRQSLIPYQPYLQFTYALWLIITWMSLAHIWTNYYLDLWAVTDRRIIAINQLGLFRRQVGSFRLEKLQDMNIEINGFIATMLDYGSIEAQTASGSEEEFQASFIPKPREVKSLILTAADNRLKQ